MSYFGTIYADTELPSRARAVYMYLRDRADSEGKCWPGIKTIASDMRLSRSTVKRALTDLEQHGYLQKILRKPCEAHLLSKRRVAEKQHERRFFWFFIRRNPDGELPTSGDFRWRLTLSWLSRRVLRQA